MRKRHTFFDDHIIGPRLDEIPENEKSTIIRMALRAYFGISKPEPLTPVDARLVARELMNNLKNGHQ